MPFKSEKQRSFLKRTKPELYKKWKKEYGSEIKPKGGGKMKNKVKPKKVKRKPSSWNVHLMSEYSKMKKKDPTVKLSDAMKVAKVSYKPKK